MTTDLIQPLHEGQIPDLLEIEQQSHIAPWSQKIFESSFNARSHQFGLSHKGQLVGFYFCQFVANEMTLENICIDKSQQGKGFARKLMQHLIVHASAIETEEIWLEVRESNHSAIQLYKSFGFEQMGLRKNYYAIPNAGPNASLNSAAREHALLMRKLLT